MRLDGIRAARAEMREQHEQDLANWRSTIRTILHLRSPERLREFLAISADVDFAATLKAQETGQLFANPAYQAKSVAVEAVLPRRPRGHDRRSCGRLGLAEGTRSFCGCALPLRRLLAVRQRESSRGDAGVGS